MNAVADQPLTKTPDPPAAESFRLISSIAELQRLAPAWQDLLDHSAEPEPMRAPAWLLTWWQVYGRDRELKVGLWYAGDELVGLAPLCRRRFWHRPGIPFRRLEFLGSDVDEDDGVCSDYLQLIIRKGHEVRITHAFAQALTADVFGSWDECVLSALAGESELTHCLVAALKQTDSSVTQTTTIIAPFLTLSATWEDYLHSLTKKKRQSLTYALRDFKAWAEADWRLEIAQNQDQLTEGIGILTELNTRRWQDEAQGGAFASQRFRAFHEQYARLALDQEQLLLLWITVRNEPVAALYALVANGKTYFYQCGRQLDAPPKVRLGIVLVIFAMQEAIRRGLGEFDFLGGAAQYKSLFTSTERPICQVRAVRRGPKEFVRQTAHALLHWVRSVGRGVGAGLGRLRNRSAQRPADEPSPSKDVNSD